MSYPSPFDVGRGVSSGLSSFIKHGNNHEVGTTYDPITSNGNLMLPTPANAQRLRVVSTSANDTADGSGGRSVVLVDLNLILERKDV